MSNGYEEILQPSNYILVTSKLMHSLSLFTGNQSEVCTEGVICQLSQTESTKGKVFLTDRNVFKKKRTE